MGVVIDTTELIAMERDALQGDPSPLSRLPDESHISAVSLFELLSGTRAGPLGRRRTRALEFAEELLTRCEVLLPFGRAEAEMAAEIQVHLRRAGTPMGGADLQIAATALVHGHTVATRNAREFGRVPGLTVHSLA